jgi:hypothetical protein
LTAAIEHFHDRKLEALGGGRRFYACCATGLLETPSAIARC